MTRQRVSPLDLIGACLWLDMEAHRKLVLLSLCENADSHGMCYPGNDYVARRASIAPRNVSTHLKALAEEGWARVVRPARGPGSTTVRHLNVDRIITEGRARQDDFGRNREREKPPLLSLLEDGGKDDDSSPIRLEMDDPNDRAKDDPNDRAKDDAVSPQRLIPDVQGTSQIKGASSNQPAEPASSPQTALQIQRTASDEVASAGEKNSPAADQETTLARLLKVQLSAEEFDTLLDCAIGIEGDVATIDLPREDYAKISDRTAGKIRAAARGAGIGKVRLQPREEPATA